MNPFLTTLWKGFCHPATHTVLGISNLGVGIGNLAKICDTNDKVSSFSSSMKNASDTIDATFTVTDSLSNDIKKIATNSAMMGAYLKDVCNFPPQQNVQQQVPTQATVPYNNPYAGNPDLSNMSPTQMWNYAMDAAKKEVQAQAARERDANRIVELQNELDRLKSSFNQKTEKVVEPEDDKSSEFIMNILGMAAKKLFGPETPAPAQTETQQAQPQTVPAQAVPAPATAPAPENPLVDQLKGFLNELLPTISQAVKSAVAEGMTPPQTDPKDKGTR
jgi:hypothetical protein